MSEAFAYDEAYVQPVSQPSLVLVETQNLNALPYKPVTVKLVGASFNYPDDVVRVTATMDNISPIV